MKDYESLDDIIGKLKLSENIITNDFDAWIKYKEYRKIYDKLFVAYSQNIDSAPMGIYPKKYPVIFKPIINLYGMSRGFKIIYSSKDYDKNIKDGIFWMEYFPGKQINLDLIIINGDIQFYSALLSHHNLDGTFNYHESLPNYTIGSNIIRWTKKNLQTYIGCLNLEVIDNNIIEAHLRLNGDFYLYDNTFVKELENLYINKKWNIDYKIKKMYIFPIFVETNLDIGGIDFENILRLLEYYKAKTLRIDDIRSTHQKKGISRLFMYDINNLNNGIKLKEMIIKLLV